jgi:chromosome segregation ATPase
VQVQEQAAHSAPQAPAVSQETADITNRFLNEELAGILAAAEESAARIVERARATSQRQIARSNRVWREVQAEVSRFASWRQDVEPVIRTVQSKVEKVRSEIEEVPERIRQALAPMADTISSIDGDLAELADASNPPLLLTPGGLESEESDSASWGLDFDQSNGFSKPDESSEGAFDEPLGESSEQPYDQGFRASPGDEGSGHLHAG